MASADQIGAEMGDMRRRLVSQETELRGLEFERTAARRTDTVVRETKAGPPYSLATRR